LHEINPPYNLAYKIKQAIHTDGTGTFVFPLVALNNNYYLVVKHRNTLETWSALPVNLIAPVTNYDFTTAASKAFGNNQANLGGGLFGIYSGDINQDQVINLLDMDLNKNDAANFLTGYIESDLTGDWIVESADVSLIENNVTLALVLVRP
jgi:hypothetical protein